MATAGYGEWYETLVKTRFWPRGVKPLEEKETEEPRGVDESKRVEKRFQEVRPRIRYSIFFSFFFFSSAASYSLIIAIQGGHGLLIVRSGIDETRFAVTVIKPSSFHEITCRELVLPENLITAVLCTLDARIGGSRNNVIPAA